MRQDLLEPRLATNFPKFPAQAARKKKKRCTGKFFSGQKSEEKTHDDKVGPSSPSLHFPKSLMSCSFEVGTECWFTNSRELCSKNNWPLWIHCSFHIPWQLQPSWKEFSNDYNTQSPLAPWLPHLESELFHINVHVSQNVNLVQNNADLSMRTSDPTQSMKDIEKTNADKTKQKVLISNITFCQLFSPPAFIFNLLNLRKKASSSASSGCNHLQVTLLMEEILHHLGGIKPCK